METIDQEFLKASLDFIDRAHQASQPFFVWFNSSRMHIWTRLAPDAAGKTGLGLYPDGLVEHDGHVGQLLKKLDDLAIAQNTIVIYSTDNGAETFSWPDGGTTPFRGEKNTNWEGGYRVPAVVRWPGLVPPGSEVNALFSHEDWVQTLMAAVGEPDIKDKLMKGFSAAGKSFKVHLDGYDRRDLLAYLRANGFKTFIVSGGGVEFMRAFAEKVYGIPPEQIIGSVGKQTYELRDGKPVLMKLPAVEFVDDKEGKPISIQKVVGRRPIAAFGNSDGDLPMLQWTAAGEGARFCLYVHHTDAEREWAYDRQSSIGRLDKGLDEAQAKGWTVVDMKRDWTIIFPFEKH